MIEHRDHHSPTSLLPMLVWSLVLIVLGAIGIMTFV